MIKFTLALFASFFMAMGPAWAITPSDKQALPNSNQFLVNAGFENGKVAWTASVGTLTSQTSTYLVGKAAGSWVLSAQTGSVYQDVTTPGAMNFQASAWINTTATTVQICGRSGGAVVSSTCQNVSSNGQWVQVSANIPAPASGTVGIQIQTSASTTGTVYIDQAYLGPAANLTLVSQAQLVGAVVITGCAANWNTASTSYAAFAAQTGCSYATVGSALAPSTNIPGIQFASLPPGEYKIEYEGTLLNSVGTGVTTCYQFSDGTNTAREQSCLFGYNNTGSPTISESINYSTAQSNVTLSVRGKVASGNESISGTTANPGVIRVYYYPSSGQLAVASQNANFGWTNGGVNTITATTTNPTKGTTSKDSIYFKRNGQNLDVHIDYAQTGAGSAGTGDYLFAMPSGYTIDTSITGTYTTVIGSGSLFTPTAKVGTGISGGPSNIISGGVYVYDSTHVRLAGVVNSGSGANVGAVCAGSNGLNNAAQTYSIDFSVPIVGWTQNQNAPVLIGSITSNSTGAERLERVNFYGATSTSSCTSSPCTIGSQSGSWVTSVTRTGTGAYTVNIPAGTFSAVPICTTSVSNNIGSKVCQYAYDASTTTALSFLTVLMSTVTASDAGCEIICMGPR